jgi:O-antigen/teichoic acid export membrane protein
MLSSADRYFSVLLNLVTLLVTARLLTPAEFGIAVIGLSVLGIADIIRDFGGVAYLVQVDTVTPQRVQTVFTVTFLLTLPFIGLVLFLAKPIADFYGSPGLQLFLQIASLCFLLGPFIAPANALLRREFAFGKLAVMNGASVVLNATVTIVLAMLGFSYMCFVWGGLASGLLYFVACLIWGPKIKIYRFALDEWRHVTAFGVYDSAKNMLHYAYETAPYLAFGKTLGPDGLGLFQRALSISRLPEKTLLAGLAPVILPALSQLAREGRDLKAGFLSSIEHVTALLADASGHRHPRQAIGGFAARQAMAGGRADRSDHRYRISFLASVEHRKRCSGRSRRRARYVHTCTGGYSHRRRHSDFCLDLRADGRGVELVHCDPVLPDCDVHCGSLARAVHLAGTGVRR